MISVRPTRLNGEFMTLTKDFNVAFYTRLVAVSRYAGLFKEEDHPRDDDGQFRRAGSSARNAPAGPKKPSKKPAAAQGALFQAKKQPGLFDTAPKIAALPAVEKTGEEQIREFFNQHFNGHVSARKADTETVPGPAVLAAMKEHGLDTRREPLAGQKSMFHLRDTILRELYARGEISVERYRESTADGRWITIGGGENGKGTHVKVKGGKIVTGPPAITGKDLDELPSRDKGDDDKAPAKPKPLPGWKEFQLKREPAERPNPNKAKQRELGYKQGRKVGPGLATVGDLHVDPERFQYKLNTTGKKGVTGQFSDIKFNPEFAGTLHVWHDTENDKTYVVNGHHRHELAERSGYAGKLQVHYLDAANAEEARAKGALINIAGGNGTAVDAAKFMRDTGTSAEELREHGVSLKGQVAKDAATLSTLSPGIFRRLVLGTYRMGRALAIAQHLPEHNDQDRLDHWIDRYEETKNKDLSDTTVEEMARDAAQSARQQQTTKGLFGDETEDRSLFVERAELKGALRREITGRLNKFRAVATEKAASTLEGSNKINATENKRTADRLAQFLDDFDRETSYKGPVSDTLNQAAQELANAPGKRKQILDRLTTDIRSILETVPQDEPAAESGLDSGSGGIGEDRGIEDAGRQYTPAAGQKGFFARQLDRESERAVYRRARLTEALERELYRAGMVTPRAMYA